MTGKELVLVLAGAAAAAGAGGVAAAKVLSGSPAVSPDETALLERLDRLAESIEGTNEILDASRAEIGGLRDRIEAVEMGVHGARSAPRTNGRRRVDVSSLGTNLEVEETADGRVVELGSAIDPEGADAEMTAAVQEALAGLKQKLQGGHGTAALGTLLGEDGQVVGLSPALEGLQRSFELRRLPEEERWQRARDEVGLNDLQVDEIKAALEERDEAIDESMVVERDDEDGNGRITVRRMDFAKTREANQAYRERVDNVLNDQQKKAWKDGGFDNAFGRGAMGSATVISVGTFRSGGPDGE